MTTAPTPAADLSIDLPTGHEPKLRHCLMCNIEFASAWVGERLCSRCKGTSAWRRGAPPSHFRAGGRRSRHSSDG